MLFLGSHPLPWSLTIFPPSFMLISEPSKEMFNAYIAFKMGAPEDTSRHNDSGSLCYFSSNA